MNKQYTETTDKQSNFAYDELSSQAKKILSYIYLNTLSSPLQFCRVMQENATPQKYLILLEIERYLINE